ncbi:MAG: Flp family type IVb pilin [Vicinamibacterales bacterium]
MGRWLARLYREECGQDLLEYVLLTAAIGVVGIATWPLIEAAVRTTYQALDANAQGLWEPPAPGSGGGGGP